MKKLVRVSLFVLMALTLSLAIGCKHDSDPEQNLPLQILRESGCLLMKKQL